MDTKLDSRTTDDRRMHGYPRATVDDFLAAAAVERARLEEELEQATARADRARAQIGVDRVMMRMLLDAQRDVGEIRARAEERAAEIIATAERDAQEVVARERSDRRVSPPSRIDLVEVEEFGVPAVVPTARLEPGSSNGSHAEAESDEFFDFLRGALTDDQPLGPLPE